MTPFAALALGTFLLRAVAVVCIVSLRQPMVHARLAVAWIATTVFAGSYCLASLRGILASPRKLLDGSIAIDEAIAGASFPFLQSIVLCLAAISAVATVHLRPRNPQE